MFANNLLGLRVTDWLHHNGVDIAGLVLHPPSRARFSNEIIAAAGNARPMVADWTQLSFHSFPDQIAAMGGDIGVSVMFGYKMPPAIFNGFPRGCINIHPSLLPYNRGADPNVWPIVDGTPAGVTIHWVDDNIDTGPVIAQREVPVLPIDTGASLYQRLGDESLALFIETWPSIVAGSAPRRAQVGEGTYHKRADLASLDAIDLDATYTARELIDRLRARTFHPYPGVVYAAGERRVRIRVELEYDDGGMEEE